MQPVPCAVNPGAPCYRESEEWIRWVYGKGYFHSFIPHVFIEPFDMCQVGLDPEENKNRLFLPPQSHNHTNDRLMLTGWRALQERYWES